MIQPVHHVGGGSRAAAGAGHFYPAEATALRRLVGRLMAEAKAAGARGELVPGRPKALIAPHDELSRSGGVAARAYATVEPLHATIQRVVLVGPAHHGPVRGLATCSAEAFDTPLGAVPVDREAVRSLSELPAVREDDATHGPEHSLEVHLPFLFHVLGAPRAERGAGSGFRIVPLLCGQTHEVELVRALAQVWGGSETLIVVSSDLSRAEALPTGRRLDRQTMRHILDGQIELIGAGDATNHVAIRALMRLVWGHRLHPRLLEWRSVKGDGSDANVSGYASIVYS